MTVAVDVAVVPQAEAVRVSVELPPAPDPVKVEFRAVAFPNVPAVSGETVQATVTGFVESPPKALPASVTVPAFAMEYGPPALAEGGVHDGGGGGGALAPGQGLSCPATVPAEDVYPP